MAFNVVNKRLYAGILYFYLNYSTWFEPSWRSNTNPLVTVGFLLVPSVIVVLRATNVLLDGSKVDSRRSPLTLIGTVGTLMTYENSPKTSTGVIGLQTLTA